MQINFRRNVRRSIFWHHGYQCYSAARGVETQILETGKLGCKNTLHKKIEFVDISSPLSGDMCSDWILRHELDSAKPRKS